VGVILNLAVWFALHVLFGEVHERRLGPLQLAVPEFSTLSVPSLVLATGAAVATFRFKAKMLPVLGVCAAAGAAWRLLAT
jgi:chromate transporter